MWDAISNLIQWLIGHFFGTKESADERLGRTEAERDAINDQLARAAAASAARNSTDDDDLERMRNDENNRNR